MKIWGDNPKVFGIYNRINPPGRVVQTDVVASKKDEFKISGQAKDFQVAMKALRNIPDIRKEKVFEVSQKIENGQYDVKAEDVAEKLIQNLFGERV